MAELVSRPYNPDPEYCCEACVFGRGEHAEWCEKRVPGCNRPQSMRAHSRPTTERPSMPEGSAAVAQCRDVAVAVSAYVPLLVNVSPGKSEYRFTVAPPSESISKCTWSIVLSFGLPRSVAVESHTAPPAAS
jgi:hypothetical protein